MFKSLYSYLHSQYVSWGQPAPHEFCTGVSDSAQLEEGGAHHQVLHVSLTDGHFATKT